LLDAMIRDATDGEKGFDDVMLRLWRDHYLEGEGFDTDDILTYFAEHIGEEPTEAFYHRYIDGREPLPYAETLSLIGLAYLERTDQVPFLGVATVPAEQGEGVVIQSVTPGSSADEAGLREGDLLLAVGAVEASGPAWGEVFRQTYAGSAGESLVVTFRRDGEETTGETTVDTRKRKRIEVAPDPEAGERAKRLREGLVAG
ncbi:MAG: PDZ domain-containing protein, partial [Gemmatimonadota bacterium]|nr:PDZ domain-containing protein [Gemmatimonadota bacterium]